MTCEECGKTEHLGSNCPEIQADVNYINNNNYCPQQIKDGTNRGRTTKVTNKVISKVTITIISINSL
jgi:hypothetical protein